MFLLVNLIKLFFSNYGLLSLLILTMSASKAEAHKVQVTDYVGAILHIEPNDTPRAGEPSQAWFALTRKGGAAISLEEYYCQLVVYAEPYVLGDTPVLKPDITTITADRYRQGILGTILNFPNPGGYQLELSGTPVSLQHLQPFNLKFKVTVVVGNSNNQLNQPIFNIWNNTSINFALPLIVIILVIIGVPYFPMLRKIRKR